MCMNIIFAVLFAGITVQTARLDSLYNDALVVTNVTGASTDPSVVSNIVENYGYVTTNAAKTIASSASITNAGSVAYANEKLALKAQIVYEDYTHRPMITNDVEATKGNFQNLDANKFDVLTSMSAEKATIHNLIVDESFDMSELDVSVGSIYAGGNIATVDGDIITTNGTIKIGNNEIVKGISVNTGMNFLHGDVVLEIPKRGNYNAGIGGYNAAFSDGATSANRANQIVDVISLEKLYWNSGDERWVSLEWNGSDYEERDNLAWLGDINGCVQKTGGTMTGDLVFKDPNDVRHLTIGFDGIIRGEGEGSFYLPNRADDGTIAMTDNIPTASDLRAVTYANGAPETHKTAVGILSTAENTAGTIATNTVEAYITPNNALMTNAIITVAGQVDTNTTLFVTNSALTIKHDGVITWQESFGGYKMSSSSAATVACADHSTTFVTATGTSALTITPPAANANGEARDFIVCINTSGTNSLNFAAFTTLYATEASVTNAIKEKVTMLYFTEMKAGEWLVGRQEAIRVLP